MPFLTITKGLTIKVPTRSTKNWDSTLVTELFNALSSHTHQGSGAGNQIAAAAIEANAVDDSKIRLRNGQWLRARNSADTGDIQLIRANSSDAVEVSATIVSTMGQVSTNEPGAAPSGLVSGKTYFQPNYILSSTITFDIVSGASMTIAGFIQVLGTLTVTGSLEVI